jgi:hypothetical protein
MNPPRPLSAAELAAIEARAAAASPPPWKPEVDCDRGYIDNQFGRIYIAGHVLFVPHCLDLDGTIERQAEVDADFIVHARTDIPNLLATIRALAARVAASEDHERRLRRLENLAEGRTDDGR